MMTQQMAAITDQYALSTRLTGTVNGSPIELTGSGIVQPLDGLTHANYSVLSIPQGFDPHLFSVFLITGLPGASKTLEGAHNIFFGRNQSYTRRVVFSNGDVLDYRAQITWHKDRTESIFVLNGSVTVPELTGIEPLVETWIPHGPGRVTGYFTAAWKSLDGGWIVANVDSEYLIDTTDVLRGLHHRYITIQTVVDGNHLTKSQQVTLFRMLPYHPIGELPD
jgi:hypothetical protein